MKLNNINEIKKSKIKLTIKYTITTLIILTILIGAFYLIYSNSMYKNFDLSIQDRAISIASTLLEDKEKAFEELKSISSIIENYNLGNESILILDLYGNIIYGIIQENFSLPKNIKPGFYNLVSKEEDMQKKIRGFIININNSNYYLLVARSYDDLMSSLQSVFFSFSLVVPFILLIILVLSYKFANEAIKPIEESMRRLKQFTSDASHELKTPISTIKANIEVALLKDREPSYYKEKLKIVLNSINRMSKLIQEMFYLSKLDMGIYQINIENFNLKELLEEIKKEFEGYALSKNISIIIESKEDMFVKTDKDGLYQILLLLIENAIEYNRENGYVKIYFIRKGDLFEICVEDSGIGIKKDYLPFIFNRFFRGERSCSSEKSGFGLGLSIVKELVDRIDGKIFVKSEEGKGTKFTLVIKG